MNYTYTHNTHTQGTNYYKVTPNSTAYDIRTPDSLVEILEEARASRTRLHIFYGDLGREWGDSTRCTIGRSNGNIKVPLAIKTARSTGGESILTHCIARIKRGTQTVYDRNYVRADEYYLN